MEAALSAESAVEAAKRAESGVSTSMARLTARSMDVPKDGEILVS